MSAGGISRLRSLRSIFSHVAPLVSKLAVSKVSRCSPATALGPLWHAMQNLSSAARWVVEAAEEGSCGGEFGAGEFCADSVATERKTAAASGIPSGVSPRSQLMNAPSHPQTGQSTAKITPILYPLTTQFSAPLVPSFAPVRSV